MAASCHLQNSNLTSLKRLKVIVSKVAVWLNVRNECNRTHARLVCDANAMGKRPGDGSQGVREGASIFYSNNVVTLAWTPWFCRLQLSCQPNTTPSQPPDNSSQHSHCMSSGCWQTLLAQNADRILLAPAGTSRRC